MVSILGYPVYTDMRSTEKVDGWRWMAWTPGLKSQNTATPINLVFTATRVG